MGPIRLNIVGRLTNLVLVGTSLIAFLSVRAQLNDGKPDREFSVPERLDLEYALVSLVRLH